MKLLVLILSFSALSAVAAVAKMKSNTKRSLTCRDNDHYCQSKLNESEQKNSKNEENSLNQFDGKLVNDVAKTMNQNDVIKK